MSHDFWQWVSIVGVAAIILLDRKPPWPNRPPRRARQDWPTEYGHRL